MAAGIRFNCSNCPLKIEAWDDGNPYYYDDEGKKIYAYHPSDEVMFCVGNDSPHLCLACGKKFMVDSAAPVTLCPKCKSSNIRDTFRLSGKKCPKCKQGVFVIDPEFRAIS